MCKILLTKGVSEYRSTIRNFVTSRDTVLEIGFAWGTTTNLLYRYAGKVIGIDKSSSYHAAKRKYPYLELYQIDGFDIKAVLDLGYKFNKIYIDISGCRDVFSVMKMILMYKAVFQPELIVVKSSKLKKLVAECEVWK